MFDYKIEILLSSKTKVIAYYDHIVEEKEEGLLVDKAQVEVILDYYGDDIYLTEEEIKEVQSKCSQHLLSLILAHNDGEFKNEISC